MRRCQIGCSDSQQSKNYILHDRTWPYWPSPYYLTDPLCLVDITMISNLLANHEQVIRTLRKDADRCEGEYGKYDMGTNDFLIGLMEKHEKMAWMLRAHLDK
jgi:Ferritin-like domain